MNDGRRVLKKLHAYTELTSNALTVTKFSTTASLVKEYLQQVMRIMQTDI